jgi:hypothetical protein
LATFTTEFKTWRIIRTAAVTDYFYLIAAFHTELGTFGILKLTLRAIHICAPHLKVKQFEKC